MVSKLDFHCSEVFDSGMARMVPSDRHRCPAAPTSGFPEKLGQLGARILPGGPGPRRRRQLPQLPPGKTSLSSTSEVPENRSPRSHALKEKCAGLAMSASSSLAAPESLKTPRNSSSSVAPLS